MSRSPIVWLGGALASVLVVLLVLPMVALGLSTSPDGLATGLRHPLFFPALWMSLRTTLCSLAVVVTLGTPLAWWLAASRSELRRIASFVIDLPIVLPPAVVGVALLQTFGRQGLLGPALESVGVGIPFTGTAVVIAQVVVAAPFYVQAASNAFREVDPDTMIVARTLGAGPAGAFWRVALPIALPGLIVGASLAWARALGEFGATLLFAGNLPGTTQTMPLAVFTALERDVELAVVFSLVLAALGGLLLLGLRLVPALRERLR